MILIAIFLIVLSAVLFYVLVLRLNLHSMFIKNISSGIEKIEWKNMGPTPLGENKFTPQGMTWVDGKIIFANTWKNTKSRVYEIDPESMKILRTFDMPEGAVHTSGLAWDDECLWAVDFISNRSYCINLERSLTAGEVSLVGSFDTTLKGTSACCIVPWEGNRYLAVSDFMHSRRTIFIRPAESLAKGTAQGAIDFSYRNEGFSQGLEYLDGYLYEAENKFGLDIINKIDLQKLAETCNSRKASVAQLAAPSRGVEDLAWTGKALWTSDESEFKFFKGEFR